MSQQLYVPAADPPTKLGRYRQLGPLAGVHVSPLCLGAMGIGDQWEKFGMGAMDKASSFALLDAYYDAGGNFIDTANVYQEETSEAFIGEWMEQRGNRDQMVIATKVRCCVSPAWSDFTSFHLGGSIREFTNSPTRTSNRRFTTRVTMSKPCTFPSMTRSRSFVQAISIFSTSTG